VKYKLKFSYYVAEYQAAQWA